MPTQIRTALFDFDGTLAHLSIDFDLMREKAMEQAALVLQKSIPQLTIAGLPLMENIYALCKMYPDKAAELMQKTELAVSKVEVEAAENSELFSFALALLHELKQAGLRCAIVTRNCRAAVTKVFPNHARLCGCLVCRDDINAEDLKPNPGQLLKALQLTGTPPQNAIMIGDHPLDIAAGKAAGCLTGAVLTGNTTAEVMHAAAPDYMAENVALLFKQLNNLLCS